MIKLPTLPTGLRVLQLPSTSNVVYCGIAVHAGTRNETQHEQGLAHFCEHLTFKGTERRSAMRIINDIEGLGGELNAFTNKEDTVFYCVIERSHVRRAIDVLTDIVFNSQYPQHEVEKECEVVCDEIESYEDSPAELIYDDIEDILFAGHPLGHNILGTAQQVRAYTSADVKRFAQRWYQPENCVLFITQPAPSAPSLPQPFPGGAEADDTPIPVPLTWEGAEASFAPREHSGEPIVRQRGTHQAHVMMATISYAASDPRRWALYLLNNILGGPGMNSRLNLALRERRGLVYTVDSSMVSYSDTGMWNVYFGCDPADVTRCTRVVRRELDRLMQRPLTDRQLRAAKLQLQGQLAIACENREQFVLDCARTYLHTGMRRTLNHVMQHISTLTPTDLQRCAQHVFAPERITTLIYQ